MYTDPNKYFLYTTAPYMSQITAKRTHSQPTITRLNLTALTSVALHKGQKLSHCILFDSSGCLSSELWRAYHSMPHHPITWLPFSCSGFKTFVGFDLTSFSLNCLPSVMGGGYLFSTVPLILRSWKSNVNVTCNAFNSPDVKQTITLWCLVRI
jgi:hypothetical protein